jgi:alpha-galactosidase
MIIHENGVFLLSNQNLSMLLRVNTQNLLELLHFGGPISMKDAAAMIFRNGPGWGASVLLDENDGECVPDVIRLGWSGSGRGDYRESPLELAGQPTDLRYVGYRIIEDIVPMSGQMPQAQGTAQTLEITMEQPGLRLKLYFTLFERAITRRTVLENTGDKTVVLQKIMSNMLDLPGDYEITTFDGGWIAEMRKHTLPVLDSRVVNESVTGFSSHRHNPGFLLSEPEATEDTGRVYGFNLVYSGNHYGAAQRSLQGLTRVVQGISPSNFAKELAPGAIFETPEAVMTFSDSGFGGMSRFMHDFVNSHIVPAYWRGRPRPVLYNDWEGCMFDFNQPTLLGLA